MARKLKNTHEHRRERERLKPNVCEATGIKFELVKKFHCRTPSVDRINPRGPYSPRNCRVIIWFLNKALSDKGDKFAVDVFRRYVERFN